MSVLLTKQGTIAAKTGTGLESYIGIGFQPKGILFWATLQTADGFGGGSVGYMMIGFAGSDLSNGIVGWAADDAAAVSNMGQLDQTLACVAFATDGDPTQQGQAHIDSMDADGFTLDWTQPAGSAWVINYLAIGGTAIEETRAGPVFLNTSPSVQSSGNPNFQPDFVMVINGDDPWPSIGWASSPDDQACMFWAEEDTANPTNIKQTWSPGNLIGGYRAAPLPPDLHQDFLCALSAFTATGFELTFSDLPANTRAAVYFAIKGGRHKVGVDTVPAATGIQTLTADFPIKAAGFFSDMKAAASDDSFVGYGMTDGVDSRATAYLSEDAAHPTVTDMYASDDLLVAGATVATPSADSVADIDSIVDDEINLEWTAVSGDEENYSYWLMGDAPVSLVTFSFSRTPVGDQRQPR